MYIPDVFSNQKETRKYPQAINQEIENNTFIDIPIYDKISSITEIYAHTKSGNKIWSEVSEFH